MAAFVQPSPSPLLRAAAVALRRLADRLERAPVRCLPLEPLFPAECADERIDERRHQVFTRDY
jgi:hypothetical protein